MVLRALVIWVVLAMVAIAAGTLRESLLVPRVGDAVAHVMGTAVVVAGMWVVIGLSVRWIVPSLEPRELLRLGAAWTALTIAFEFGFGHYVVGHPWSRLLADYNLLAGRVWVLVLLTSLLAPFVLGRWRSEG